MSSDFFEATGVMPLVVEQRATQKNRALQPTLVCVSGAEMGKSFPIAEDSVVIGRANADIKLGDRDVSRQHARLGVGAHGYVLEDLGSVNGTLINGQRIRGQVPVSVGDRIQLGHTVLVFTVHDELEQRVGTMLRLEAMATLAGGIAHDFNNALSVVMCNLDMLSDSIPQHDTDAQQSLEEMRHATQTATLLARKLLRLGRSEPQPFAAVPLAALATETVAMARRRTKQPIEISTDVAPHLQVLGSADELRQVLLNLCFNACDAMPAGGTLAISAREVRLDTQTAVAHQLAAPGDYVEIRVADSGHGMDRETLARAFEPFFTTKSRDEGTGLGLAMVHTVVRRHAGAIDVESQRGHGTTFRILLPRPNVMVG
jgi:signal transduction histidine kinase